VLDDQGNVVQLPAQSTDCTVFKGVQNSLADTQPPLQWVF